MPEFDHIAIASNTLERGEGFVQKQTGIEVPKGGQHHLMGTHNCLTALGPDTFLEVIAIDPEAQAPDRPRWFDLDNPKAQSAFPRLQAWLLRTDDIEGCIAMASSLGVDLGEPLQLTRGDLRWRFTVRPDGTIPLGGAAPLILQWDNGGPHPATRMTDLGLRLKSLTIETPRADELSQLLKALGLMDKPDIIPANQTKIITKFYGPNGQEVSIN